MEDSGERHFHLYLATNKGCVADVTFSVSPSSTEVNNMEVETLILGHGSQITGLAASGEHFVTCGLDRSLIMWDTIAHKSKWIENVR